VTKISGTWHNEVRTFIATKFFMKGKKAQIKVVQKIQTHFMSNTFFSKNRAFYKVVTKNTRAATN